MPCFNRDRIERITGPREPAFTGIKAEAETDFEETTCGGGETCGWD
jgi:hypothetical protein